MVGFDYCMGKSRNAVNAERKGKMTASALAKRLKVTTRAVKETLVPWEWHHTSKYYNKTDYYDEPILLDLVDGNVLDGYEDYEIEEAKEDLLKMKEYDAQQKKAKKTRSQVTYLNCKVNWIDWGGTRKHPIPYPQEAIADVTDTGGCYVVIRMKNGTTFRKKKGANGFSVEHERFHVR